MRFVRIGVGYLAAAYCASLPLFWFLLPIASPNLIKVIWILPYFAAHGMLITVPATIFQSALFIAISERFSIRMLPYYLCAGLLTGLTAVIILLVSHSAPLLKGDWFFYLIFAAAGAVCGAVYWGIAGREAGLPAQTTARRMSNTRCLLAGSIFSAVLTGVEVLILPHNAQFLPMLTGAGLLILPLDLPREASAGMAILCFLVHAALGAYFVCAFAPRKAAAAVP